MIETASGQLEDGRNDSWDDATILIEPRSLTRQCLAAWLEQSEHHARICAVTTPGAAAEHEGEHAVLLIWCIGALPVTSEMVVAGVQQLREHFPTTPLAFLADREDPTDVRAAIRLGVTGYVPTSLDRSEALEVLKFVRAGGTYVPASALVDDVDIDRESAISPCQGRRGRDEGQANMFEGLTPREADVVERLRQGKPNKVIAHELDISESTVKVFVHRILNKLGAVNRTEVAYLAQQQASQVENRSKPIRLRSTKTEEPETQVRP
jgi:DNA-binding NarL/FixJ family response regulator